MPSYLAFNFTGFSLVTMSLVLTGLPAKSLTIGNPIKVGVVNNGTQNGTLNISDSVTGKGFGNSFTKPYIILGAQNNSMANDANDTGNIRLSRYAVPFEFTINDLQKASQKFSFNLAFNGNIGGTPGNDSDLLVVNIMIRQFDGSFAPLPDENPLFNQYANQAAGLVPTATPFERSINSSKFQAGTKYRFSFILTEYDFLAATVNTAVGINNVKINDVAVPEPLTLLGAGTALGFGTFFKRELSKKQKKEKAKV